MELKHIDIARLSVSALNMRGTKKSCDIADILPSVHARGVLVPLIVRERVAGEGEIDESSDGLRRDAIARRLGISEDAANEQLVLALQLIDRSVRRQKRKGW